MKAGFIQRRLEKSAFHGSASVPGGLSSTRPEPTVGQAMYDIVSNPTFGPSQKRKAIDGIVASGVDVNSPLTRLAKAGIGALAGNFIATTLGAGPFSRGVMTARGYNYGWNS